MVSNIYNSGVSAFRRSKGFKTYVYNSLTTDISLVYPQGKKGLKGQYFQDSQGFKGSMFQCYRRSKGFKVSRDRGFPLIDKGFQWNWRFQNPRVSGKYINMSSIKISSSVHSVPLCSLSILWSINGQWEIYLILETGPMGERTPREGIRVSK